MLLKEGALETRRITESFQPQGEPPPGELLQPGMVLAHRYQIQGTVGVGGMGAVYRARDLHFPNVLKVVAVKEMINASPDPVVRQNAIKNFEREANILATLSHPAIPRIYDYFSESNRSYLVLEYIHGKDLEAILNDTPDFLPEEQVVQWAIELCDVLDYLHSHKPDPIIFRDMKPSNVMISTSGDVILVDFGIAKVFQAGQKGTMIGTEGYSPPEQYRGEATPLADIYALGATLHHVLTRRDPRLEPPFSFGERPIRQINPDVSPELEAVINRMLQYNPEDRFQSAREAKEALIAVAKKTGLLSRLSVPTAPIQSSDIKPLWVFTCEDEIRATPTWYQGVLYVGSYDSNLYALDASSGEFLWKYATEGAIVGKPAVVEDTVIVGSEDFRLHAVSIRSGKVLWTYYTEAPVRCSPTIAEGHVFVGSDDAHLHAVNLITGRAAWRAEVAAPVRSAPTVAQDTIFFGCESGDFYALDFRGEMRWRFKAKRSVVSSPRVANGVVYFAALDWVVYALDASAGWVLWRFRMSKGSASTPCLVDKRLFIGSADTHIYCLDASSGKEVWRFKTGHQVPGGPTVYSDSIYCGSADGYLYCLEARTGRLRWKFQTEGPIIGSPIVHDGVVYFGSADHKVYALLA